MGKKDVRLACRDCKKCTNSEVANLGRNSGRAMAGIMTLGMSEVGFLATKTCRQCGHALSLHQNEKILTSSNQPQSAPASAVASAAHPGVPAAHGLQEAAAGLSEGEVSLNRQPLEALPFLLDDDETAVLVCTGSISIQGKFLPVSTLVVLTDQWLRVVRKHDTRDTAMRIDYRAQADAKLTYQSGGFPGGALTIESPDGSTLRVAAMSRNSSTLQMAIDQQRANPPAPRDQPLAGDSFPPALDPGSSGTSKQSVVALLRELGELHTAGVLTDEEFAAQKANLLSQL